MSVASTTAGCDVVAYTTLVYPAGITFPHPSTRLGPEAYNGTPGVCYVIVAGAESAVALREQSATIERLSAELESARTVGAAAEARCLDVLGQHHRAHREEMRRMAERHEQEIEFLKEVHAAHLRGAQRAHEDAHVRSRPPAEREGHENGEPEAAHVAIILDALQSPFRDDASRLRLGKARERRVVLLLESRRQFGEAR